MAYTRITEAEYQKLSPDLRIARGRAIEQGTAFSARSTWGETELAKRLAVTADHAKAAAIAAGKRRR